MSSYARIVNACLKNSPYMHISIRLPIYNPSVLEAHLSPIPSSPPGPAYSSPTPSTPRLVVSDEKGTETTSGNLDGTWEMWDVIRSICDYSPRLSLSESGWSNGFCFVLTATQRSTSPHPCPSNPGSCQSGKQRQFATCSSPRRPSSQIPRDILSYQRPHNLSSVKA